MVRNAKPITTRRSTVERARRSQHLAIPAPLSQRYNQTGHDHALVHSLPSSVYSSPQKVTLPHSLGPCATCLPVRNLGAVLDRSTDLYGLGKDSPSRRHGVTVPRQLYLPDSRRLVLPVHLLCLASLLGCIGAVAWEVKLQDGGVMDHPVAGRG